MTENPDTENLETTPPPPTTPPPAAPPTAPEQPRSRWRDRRVGVVTLAASTAAALIIGGTLGAVTGGAVGYGVGHHDHPDRPGMMQFQGQQGDGGRPNFQSPNGELPPGMVPNESDESSS